MMSLQKAPQGFTCVMDGSVSIADAEGYHLQAKAMLPTSGHFGLLVDQRNCKVLPEPVQAKLTEIIAFFASRGLTRVATVCSSAVLSMQMNRLTEGSPAAKIAYAINGKDAQWETKALAWINQGTK